jgi:hypothetical protein
MPGKLRRGIKAGQDFRCSEPGLLVDICNLCWADIVVRCCYAQRVHVRDWMMVDEMEMSGGGVND